MLRKPCQYSLFCWSGGRWWRVSRFAEPSRKLAMRRYRFSLRISLWVPEVRYAVRRVTARSLVASHVYLGRTEEE